MRTHTKYTIKPQNVYTNIRVTNEILLPDKKYFQYEIKRKYKTPQGIKKPFYKDINGKHGHKKPREYTSTLNKFYRPQLKAPLTLMKLSEVLHKII